MVGVHGFVQIVVNKPEAGIVVPADASKQLDVSSAVQAGAHDKQRDAFRARSASVVDATGECHVGDQESVLGREPLQSGQVFAVGLGNSTLKLNTLFFGAEDELGIECRLGQVLRDRGSICGSIWVN